MDQHADTVVAALLISPEPDGRRSNVQATLKNDGRAKALGVAIASRTAVADVVPTPGIDIIPLQASDCFADVSSAYSVCLTRTGLRVRVQAAGPTLHEWHRANTPSWFAHQVPPTHAYCAHLACYETELSEISTYRLDQLGALTELLCAGPVQHCRLNGIMDGILPNFDPN